MWAAGVTYNRRWRLDRGGCAVSGTNAQALPEGGRTCAGRGEVLSFGPFPATAVNLPSGVRQGVSGVDEGTGDGQRRRVSEQATSFLWPMGWQGPRFGICARQNGTTPRARRGGSRAHGRSRMGIGGVPHGFEGAVTAAVRHPEAVYKIAHGRTGKPLALMRLRSTSSGGAANRRRVARGRQSVYPPQLTSRSKHRANRWQRLRPRWPAEDDWYNNYQIVFRTVVRSRNTANLVRGRATARHVWALQSSSSDMRCSRAEVVAVLFGCDVRVNGGLLRSFNRL